MYRAEVGEHSTQPPIIDVWHTHACRLLSNTLLGLFFSPDKKHRAAMGNCFFHEFVSSVDERKRTLQIDDVNAISLRQDEALHFWIPAPSLVSKVDS